jgi:hypothetical protein
LHPVWRNQLSWNHPGIQTSLTQFSTPVVSTAACFHCDQAVRRQLGAPQQEFLAVERSICDHFASGIYGVNLDDIFGQIDADSYNVAHGTSPFNVVAD